MAACTLKMAQRFLLLWTNCCLTECTSEVERIESRVNSKKRVWLTKKKEEEEKQEEKKEVMPTTLDSYFIKNNTNYK